MENPNLRKIIFSLLLIQISVHSSAYTAPEQYFINCGSSKNTTVNRRNFIGDVNSRSFSFSFSSGDQDANPSTASSPLYETARIFRKQSWYELDLVQNGNYMVRFHFFPFSSPKNSLPNAYFNVSASGFSLLSNFTAQVNNNSPVIKEFILFINVSKFKLYFTPEESSFAFVNAIEIFLAPLNFIPEKATHVTTEGSNSNDYNGLLSEILYPVHRINVGGNFVPVNDDTLWRNWVPDDDFLHYKAAANNSPPYANRPRYQDGGATEYTAPDVVYTTAKELNVVDPDKQSNFFNITWQLNVTKNKRYFVRAHFCDIISDAPSNDKFNFYIYRQFHLPIDSGQLAFPFYKDFVVDSDTSGLLNISIGPQPDSVYKIVFLNGLEIMELMKDLSSVGSKESKPKGKNLHIIIGFVVGSVAFVLILLMVFLFVLKWRKAKAVENLDWSLVNLDGGNSSMLTERTANYGPPVANFNLGLKVPFAEILYATKNFDAKLMIGGGGFGKVYKGTLRGGIKVAVKRSEPGHGQGFPEFHTEITVLSKIRHRHLVSLIGYCDERSEMILVYEFMEKGTLREHLYEESDSKSSSPSKLSWIQRLEICIGAAKGLQYLHTGASGGGIIHRDVKSTNILLDDHFVAKVADFGLSISGPLDQTHISTEVKGSFGYLDPEYFRCLQLTQKSDVYSFGVVLLEVLCARPAINNLLPRDEVNLADWGISWQKKGQLERILDPFLVGKINLNSLRKFGETVEKCLKEYGVDRPSMVDVLWDLEYALQLQQLGNVREPYEDSNTDVSWGMPLPRLPSISTAIDEDEMALRLDNGSDTSYANATEVFSQLRIGDAR